MGAVATLAVRVARVLSKIAEAAAAARTSVARTGALLRLINEPIFMITMVIAAM
jgi:hypothetical protein